MTKDDFTGWVAASYDASSGIEFEPAAIEAAVRFLAEAANGGAALEFAIGTGRIGVPLSAAGVEVHGIDISADMLAELTKKPGAENVAVTIGDIATMTVQGTFSLVYLVYNTIANLMTQEAQVECFCNAARHLQSGGRFVIELFVPELQRLPPGDTVRAFEATDAHYAYDEIDVATQRGVSHHFFVHGDRVRRFDTPYRYVWPAELDLMAHIAGLQLRERWGDWDRSPFTSASRKHISVWEREAAR